MRTALLLLAAVVVTAAGGCALCAALGWRVNPVRVTSTALTALLSGAAASVPLLLTRGASQPAVAQAGLVGTVVHLFGCLAGAAVLLMVLHQGAAAAYWVLAFYWTTLAVLAAESARAVRAAAPAAPDSPVPGKQ